MSMNISIKAERKISYKDGKGKRKQDVQIAYFKAQQTPTDISYKIIGSDNPEAAYKDYINSYRNVELLPVYAEDDYMAEGEPLYYDEYCFADEHINDFNNWKSKMLNDGYKIEWEVW